MKIIKQALPVILIIAYVTTSMPVDLYALRPIAVRKSNKILMGSTVSELETVTLDSGEEVSLWVADKQFLKRHFADEVDGLIDVLDMNFRSSSQPGIIEDEALPDKLPHKGKFHHSLAVLNSKNEAVGIAIVTELEKEYFPDLGHDSLHINIIMFIEDYQRQGLGRIVIKKIIERFKREGYKRLSNDTPKLVSLFVGKDKEAGQEFYKKCGFTYFKTVSNITTGRENCIYLYREQSEEWLKSFSAAAYAARNDKLKKEIDAGA